MKKNKHKRTLREDIRLIVKGYKILWKMCPANVVWRFVYCISINLAPYFSLYMSALVIDEIVLGAEFNRLLTLAIITVAGNFILNILAQTIVGRIAVDYEHAQWYRNEKMMTDAESRMQYKYMEDPEIALKASKIRHYTYYGGNGVMQLFWSVWFVTQALFKIIVSVALTASMFALRAEGDFHGFLGFANNPLSAFVLIIIIGINIFVQVKCSAKRRTESKDAWNDFSEDNEKAWDMMHNTEDMHVNGARDFIREKTKNVFVRPSYITKQTKINVKYNFIGIVLNTLMNIALFIYVGAKAYIGVFGIGSFILYRGTVEKFIQGVSSLGSQLGGMRYNNDYLVELFDYMDLAEEHRKGELVPDIHNEKLEIEFKNVSFIYPGTTEYALKNISFKFKLGEKLAFVGMNGSGKTTFIKLLCRLYEPTEGKILLNGIDISKYSYEEYTKLFSVVFQDFAVFAYDIAANVSASHTPDRNLVDECLRRVGLEERMSKLEKGMDTFVTRNYENEGIDFSKGELQKIALARALYKNAPFFVLDEPTAALDPIAEADIYTRFNSVLGDKTAIFISHRLSSCRFCHRIVVFHEGELIQCGNHDVLLEDKSGKYAEMWQAQAQYYTD